MIKNMQEISEELQGINNQQEYDALVARDAKKLADWFDSMILEDLASESRRLCS